MLFIILTIDFSSLSSFSSSWHLYATVCAERCGETIVLADELVEGVGDDDLGGLLIFADGGDGDRDEALALTAFAFGLAFDLRLKLAYLDVSVRWRPMPVGRFQ